MRKPTIIETNEIDIGSKLILKNGKEVIIKGFYNSMLPTVNEIYVFQTNIGKVLPNEVERICK